LRVDDVNERSSPLTRVYNAANTMFAMAHDVNVFQIMENFQNVVGIDISYANKAPPIGAPNAQLTPADAPAAINILFYSSFLKNSNPKPGR
jgi:hypothetical protein